MTQRLYQGRVGPLRAEEPPSRYWKRSMRADLIAVMPKMKIQPKRWFRVAEFFTEQGALVAREQIKAVSVGYEWTTRRVEGGSVLWGRYVGTR